MLQCGREQQRRVRAKRGSLLCDRLPLSIRSPVYPWSQWLSLSAFHATCIIIVSITIGIVITLKHTFFVRLHSARCGAAQNALYSRTDTSNSTQNSYSSSTTSSSNHCPYACTDMDRKVGLKRHCCSNQSTDFTRNCHTYHSSVCSSQPPSHARIYVSP